MPCRTPRPGRRLALAAALLLALAALTACDRVQTLLEETPAAQQTTGPNLGLLSLPAYDDPEADATQTAADAADYMPVDLWLDGTQTMGGINTNEQSMYPHTGKKYREGGFHYHYGAQAGWYESLLRDFLAAAGDTRVRALRYGNETVPDGFLRTYGLDRTDAAQAASVWRDLHTVSVDADARFFASFSAEEMAGSFYALGAPAWLNRAAGLPVDALENPDLAAGLAAAQGAQAQALAEGQSGFTLAPGTDGEGCALLTALPNLDTSRLNVITVDPAALGKLTGADAAGKPLAFYEAVLRALGVFDQGLCVGVLDFQLDYMGQMASFTTARLSEPLVWGRVILDEKKQTYDHLGVMPRRLLTLVIGTRARVNGFIERLGEAIDADRALSGTRGPRNGELTYTADGQTVVQEPFSFAWNHTVIARPGMGTYTQHTPGATLSAQTADGTALQADAPADAPPSLTLTAAADGTFADATLTLRLPVTPNADGATLDVRTLTGATVQPLASLLLGGTLPNTPQNAAAADGAQWIAYRDTLYRFDAGADASAFRLGEIRRDGDFLVCTLQVSGASLKTGLYRLRLAADVTGDQVAWESVPWIDGDQSVGATVTDADVYAWETFTAAMTAYDRDAKGLPKMFAHAWGGATDKLYHGLRVPDFPPVYRSVGLAELAAQVRAAAASDTRPLIRFTFEVRTDGG
ncbi:MAG: hypothetical protein VB104_09955 [Candidatus Limiplasma sp.]|nr:hypothetical protein [Candidatus Limiplasma sp.]